MMTRIACLTPQSKLFARKTIILFFVIAVSLPVFASSAQGAEIKLAWDAVNGSNIAGYRLYYGPSSGHYTASIDAGRDTTCTVPNLAAGARCFFTVTAYTANGAESGYSNEVSCTVPTDATLSSITIGGPSQVDEDSHTQFTCTAHYSDGSSSLLAGGVTWSEDAAATTISSSGLLTTGSVGGETAVNITASYAGETDTRAIAINAASPTLSSISINGPIRAEENSNVQFTCTAHYSDQSTSTVTDSVQWNVNSAFATIDATGQLTTRAVQSDVQATVTASFDGRQAGFSVIIANSRSNCTLNIEVIGSGTVLLDPPGGIYDDGTVVTLTAVADPAWTFDGWTGAVADAEPNTTSVTMDSDIDLAATFLEDTDMDGVSDQEEWGSAGNDPDFDGNADGTADYLQAGVASLHSGDYLNYISLSATAPGRFTMCQTIAAEYMADGPADHTLPLGVIAFRVEDIPPGAGSTVTIHLPPGSDFDTFYKFGPTPDNPSDHWFEFMYDQISETGAIIDADTITLYLKDGSRGDSDLSADGVITDPGGPAILGAAPGPPGRQLSDDTPSSAGATSGGGCFIDSVTQPRD